ncbi:MAG: ABC transporter ATP-binding protein [Phyllobacteriaceae bacterium]|nr:ABC transporter ATP-binding protein [Phyllobacteriaceae bacterium]
MIYVTHDQIEALTLADRVAIIRGGTIQQLDAPQTIYNKPKNLYVAGFIGSPSMNFLKGAVEGEGAKASFKFGGLSIPLKSYKADEPVTARAATLGVRPEHIRINGGAEDGATAAYPAVVDIVEPMGADTLIWLKVEGQTISARVESNEHYEPGQKVDVRFRINLASVFDDATTNRI